MRQRQVTSSGRVSSFDVYLDVYLRGSELGVQDVARFWDPAGPSVDGSAVILARGALSRGCCTSSGNRRSLM